MKKVLAFDFGASSGRAVLACICEGKLKIKEIHRFKNEPVTVNGRIVLGYIKAVSRNKKRHYGGFAERRL